VRALYATDDASAALVRERLVADDERERVLALRAGARRGLLDAEDWARALRDVASAVRREALERLAGEPAATSLDPAVIAALADDDPLVVDAAAFALGERHCLAGVPDLVEVARHHQDARCRESAVAALGALGDERGRAAVLDALEDKAPVRRRAVVALANFEGPDIDAALARAGEDRDWQVRAAADQLTRDEASD
jgi:HEAT repeat protein